MNRIPRLILVPGLIALLTLSTIAQRRNLRGFSSSLLQIVSAAVIPTSTTIRQSLKTTSPRRMPHPLEDFDIRADHQITPADSPVRKSANDLSQPESSSPESSLIRERPGTMIRRGSLTASPSRVYSTDEALSASSSENPEQTTRHYLHRNRDLYRLSDDDVASLRVVRQHTTPHNGLTHLTLEQRVNGIEVFQSRFTAHLERSGAIIATTGELLPDAARIVNLTRPQLSASAALKLAAKYSETEITGQTFARSQAATEEQAQTFDQAAGFAREMNARLVYFPLAADTARLAWEFELWMKDTPDAYLIVVDAERGSLLYRYNLTNYEENPLHPHGLVYPGDSPRPDAPHKTDNPATVERQDLPFHPLPFNGATIFAINDPHYDWWAGAVADTLVSNNVDAHLDRDANNAPDLPLVKAGDGNFSFPLDLTQQPIIESDQKAAQANLFYQVNRYHDILYVYGFTEAAGNFQAKNFGLGGLESDAIQADAQDGSGTNNANFSTPPDGRAGRVQMFLWTGSPQLDGDLDQGVIIHELTHGLSNRLIGNSTGLSGFQARGMGEGWSDFIGLTLLRDENDPLDGAYAIGQYVKNNFAVGIRRSPYSTNKAIYPYTFANLSLSSSVHATGEIWCSALWEMRALLIQKYGFREGQRQSIQLVVDGLKLTPPDPTFLDARDAILLADRVNNNGANQCLMWQAFAKRGMGYSASTFGVADNAPKESFDVPPFCHDSGSIQLDKRNYVIGELIRVTLGDQNAVAPVKVEISSSVTGDRETITLTPDKVFRGSFTGALRIANGRASNGDGLLQASVDAGDQLAVTYNDASTSNGSTATITGTAGIVREKVVFEDHVENGNQGWIATGTWGIVSSRSASVTHSWTDSPVGNYANSSDTALISPLLSFANLSDVTLTFAHSYMLENRYDFGVVEYSTDEGATWTKAAAFTGSQSAFIQSKVSLDALSGKTQARLRFRLISDQAENGDGWFIDDIRLTARSADAAIIKPGTAPAPVIAAISPAFGTPTGGATVTITGANFTETDDTLVSFDGLLATSVNVQGSTTMTAVVPAHSAGAVTVRLSNHNGSAALPGGFTYSQTGSATNEPAPAMERLFPASGSTRGGTIVTLIGDHFTPETTVVFGAQSAAVTFINANTLRVKTPAAAATGTVNVTASNASHRTTLTAAFNYILPTPPTVAVLSPNGGETFYLGSTLNVRWKSADNRAMVKHRVSLVRHTGSQFVTIADPDSEVSGDAQSINWTLPMTLEATTQARIRVIATDDEGVETEAVSASDFTIAKRWETVAQLPFAVQRLAAASDGRYLYAISGRTSTASSTTVETVSRYDARNNTWTTTNIAPLPMGLSSGAAVCLNGKIYVPGGFTTTFGSPSLTHYAYDVAGNTWSQLTPVPSVAYFYALATDESRGVYYLTGGHNNLNGAIGTARSFNPQKNEWNDLPPMLSARYGHLAAQIEGKLYVAGGFGVAGGLASTEVYDATTQRWSVLASLNRPRRFATSAVGKDLSGNPLLLVTGGEDPNTGIPINTSEVYEVRNNRWITLDSSFNQVNARTLLAGAMLDGMFYTIGGAAMNGSFTATTTVPTVERARIDGFAPLSSTVPPVLAAPATQTAIANREINFSLSASDYNSTVPLTITAQGLPERASFTTTSATNNSTRGEFRWTPASEDVGQMVMVTFTASDGLLSDIRSVVIRIVEATPLAVVSAASYRSDALAPDSIVAAFGTNLAVRADIARTLPLPLELAGTSVTVNGLPAPLFFVSPTQINFAVPPGAELGESGTATIIVTSPLGTYALGSATLANSWPAIFTADATGKGDASAIATPDGITYQQAPFDVVMNGRPNILVLYGTGIRNAKAANPSDGDGVAEAVTATIGGQPARVLYAGAQGQFIGLDQMNLELPQTLGSNASQSPRRVEIVVTVNGIEANRVTVQIR